MVEDLLVWLDDKYSDENGKVTVTRGHYHVYLGMMLDYSTPGSVKINLVDYVKAMLKDFEKVEKIGAESTYPWTDKLFDVDEKSKPLEKDEAETFHTFAAKALFFV